MLFSNTHFQNQITLGYEDSKLQKDDHVLCGTVSAEEATTDIIKKSCNGQIGNHMNFKADRINICEIKIYGKHSISVALKLLKS